MDVTQVNLDSVIKACLIQELSKNKHLPYRQLLDDIAYKYTLLRPASMVRAWVTEWVNSNQKVG